MRVVLAGATGLIGSQVLSNLAARGDVDRLTTVSRRAVDIAGETHDQIVAPAEDWAPRIAAGQFDVAVCCLGTTIRDAGSREAFRAIDLDAVQDFAEASRQAGVRQFLFVTSVGADAGSRNFYLQTKGRAEAAVRAIGFDRIDVFRPGLLVGKRSGRIRVGERIAIVLSQLTDLLTPNVLSRYRSVPARVVAKAIALTAGAREPGPFVHHNDDMLQIQSERD